MASVRVAPIFQEQGILTLTLEYDTSIVYDASYYDGTNHSAQVGDLVALVSDSTAGLGSSGNYPLGKLIKVEPNACTVEIGGVVSVPYVSTNANPPLVGRGIQVDGAGNAITPAGGARLATERGTVLSLNSTTQTCYVFLGGSGA